MIMCFPQPCDEEGVQWARGHSYFSLEIKCQSDASARELLESFSRAAVVSKGHLDERITPCGAPLLVCSGENDTYAILLK